MHRPYSPLSQRMIFYQNGGHGFGLGNPDRTSNKWFDTFIYWLEVNGFLKS